MNQITRKDFEDLVNGTDISRIIYQEVLRKLDPYSEVLGGAVSFSPNIEDYRFMYKGNLVTMITRLFDSPCNLYTSPFQIKHLVPCEVPNKGLVKEERVSELLFGVKFDFQNIRERGFYQTQASLGAYCSYDETLAKAADRRTTDGFWPWDEILVQKEEKEIGARIWLHGEYPVSFEYGRYIARGVIDYVYQRVLNSLNIPQGEIVVRYSDGQHPIPVHYPGHKRCRWIGC